MKRLLFLILLLFNTVAFAQIDNVANFAKADLSMGYDASATSVVVASGKGALFPSSGYNLVWWNVTDYADPSDDPNVEIVNVTARSSDTFTIVRAQEGTSATTKNTGGKTYRFILAATAKTFTNRNPNVYDIALYGADGSGDDATYIQAACDAAYSAGGTVYGKGTFTIGTGITIKSNADFSNAVFQTSDTTITAVTWLDNDQVIQNKTVRFPEVIQTTHTNGQWPANANCIGIKIVNGYACQFYVPYIKNFKNGLLVTTNGSHGSVYSTYHLGQIISNKINIRLAPADANGWTNSNVFIGGASLHAAADGTNVAGVTQVQLDETGAVVDGNVFQGIAFESDCASLAVSLHGARTNHFRDCRWESTAKTIYQELGPGDAMPFNNYFSGGVNLRDVVVTGVQWYPIIIDAGSVSHYRGGYLSKTAVVASNYSSDNYAAFAAVADEDSVMPADHDYFYNRAGWRVGHHMSEFKSETDTQPRMKIDHGTGDVTWGPGGSTAPDVTFGRSATSTMRVQTVLKADSGFAGSRWPVVITLALSDETTSLTASTSVAKVTYRAPFAFTLTSVRTQVNTAPVGATILTDIHESGTTILGASNKVMIDASELTSVTGTTAYTITDNLIADDAELTFFADQVGSSTPGKGLKITMFGYRTLP